jgi:hypothetical protein
MRRHVRSRRKRTLPDWHGRCWVTTAAVARGEPVHRSASALPQAVLGVKILEKVERVSRAATAPAMAQATSDKNENAHHYQGGPKTVVPHSMKHPKSTKGVATTGRSTGGHHYRGGPRDPFHHILWWRALGGLAEFERELIRARTGEGRRRAKERGVRFGRPRKMTSHQRREAIARLQAGETQADVARPTASTRPPSAGWRLQALSRTPRPACEEEAGPAYHLSRSRHCCSRFRDR